MLYNGHFVIYPKLNSGLDSFWKFLNFFSFPGSSSRTNSTSVPVICSCRSRLKPSWTCRDQTISNWPLSERGIVSWMTIFPKTPMAESFLKPPTCITAILKRYLCFDHCELFIVVFGLIWQHAMAMRPPVSILTKPRYSKPWHWSLVITDRLKITIQILCNTLPEIGTW